MKNGVFSLSVLIENWPQSQGNFGKVWLATAFASFSTVGLLRTEQDFVLQNNQWSEGQAGKRWGSQTSFPLFPEHESSDFELPFFF